MQFTYDAYSELLKLLKTEGYKFADYNNYKDGEKTVILRHDIDMSLERALKMASIESQENVSAVYFILVSSDFYNPISLENRERIKDILNMGGEIGLHFDEKVYEGLPYDQIVQKAHREKMILEEAIGGDVAFISMHRPSKYCLENDIKFKGMTNAYSKKFFDEFKYVSDSRMNWREPVIDIIKSGKYDKLQVLTHPFWYNDLEISFEKQLALFAQHSTEDTKHFLRREISNLEGKL